MGRRHRPYSFCSNAVFIDALRAVLGLCPLPVRPRTDPARSSEHSLSEAALSSFDAPELVPDLVDDEERERWTEPHGGWFREQRRVGSGITKGKPKPVYKQDDTL